MAVVSVINTRIWRVLLPLCALVVLTSGFASAATIHVPSDAPTIRAGIDVASSGDTVLISCGTYQEEGIVLNTSHVCLRSESGEPNCVTINGQGQLDYILSGDGDSVILEGITFTESITAKVSWSDAHISVSNCIFGKGLPDGGNGVTIDGGTAQISDCVFRNNQGYCGGAVCAGGSNVTVERCTFENNVSASAGGAIGVLDYGVLLEIFDCSFVNNSGPTGGALAVAGNTVIVGSTFLRNHSETGAAIATWSGTTTLEFCNVAFNSGGMPIQIVESPSHVYFGCSNMYGNEGGDWSEYLASQLGENDNISADPLLCDTAGGDYGLTVGSPCLEENNACGQMGTYGPGCNNCCTGTVGNIDGDSEDMVSMSDLTVLIDNLFISLAPLACPEEAHLDSAPEVTMADLTMLIDHLFISLTPLQECE